MPDQLKHQPLPLNSDTWHLIFLATPQSDLYSITLTCKTFNALATPLLYRTITLLTPKPTTPEGISRLIHKRTTERQRASDPTNPNRTREYDRARWALLSRLETDQEIRTHVREALLPHSSSRTRYIISLRENRYHRLCRLLLGLPNLQRVKLGCVKVQKDCAPLIRAIAEHPNNPELEVTICETDRRGEFPFTVALSDPLAGAVAEHLMTLACISSLIVTVDPFTYPNGNGRRMRAVQDLFFRCPRLRCFRLTLRNPEMNAISVIDGESYPIVSSFEFPFPRVPGIVEDLELDVGAGAPQSGPGPGLGLVFPPLEELSLDGYRMDDAEWAYWRDGLEWTRLRSLSVGPQSTFGLYEQTLCGTLGQFAGFATALTTLRVHSFAGLDEGGLGGWREGLARLLEAFASLEVLELVGYWPSRAGAICRHRGLKEFTMHVDEMPLKGRERGVFSAEDFVILDRACPELRALEVDVERDGGGGGGSG
ncbi:hypothetical protein BDW74DRAFT_184100 [Aspergillus multicolor]|uniref:uncharacterized protein n=1 Tax=Aspergillus multicolor TaxID=41759 RepID=UPI003CCD12E2